MTCPRSPSPEVADSVIPELVDLTRLCRLIRGATSSKAVMACHIPPWDFRGSFSLVKCTNLNLQAQGIVSHVCTYVTTTQIKLLYISISPTDSLVSLPTKMIISTSFSALCKARSMFLLFSVTAGSHDLPYLPMPAPILFSSYSFSPLPFTSSSATRSPSPYQFKHKSQNEGGSGRSWVAVLCAFDHTAFSLGPQFPLMTLCCPLISVGGREELK